MKNSSVYLLILSIVFEVLSVSAQNNLNICDQNNGNIEINEAFRWKSQLFFFAKNGLNFKVNDFKWDPQKQRLNFSSVQKVEFQDWKFDKLRLTFPVDYPGKGLRLIEAEEAVVDSIPQLVAFIYEMDDNGGIISRNNISINVYKCTSSKNDSMNLCSLFMKFPLEHIHIAYVALTSFPLSIDGLPPRFLVYYNETPFTEDQRKKCAPNCHSLSRYIMIGENMSYDGQLNETNWHMDNASVPGCFEMRKPVDASLTLNDYMKTGTFYEFHLLEISGSDYVASRVQINTLPKPQVSSNFQTLKSGTLGTLFNCPVPTPTISPTQSFPESTFVESDEQTGETPDGRPPKGSPSEGPPPEGPPPEGPPPGGPPPEGDTKSPELGPKGSTTEGPHKSEGGFPFIWILFLIIVVIIIIGVIAWFLIPKGGAAPPPPPPPPPPSGPTPGVAPESPPGPTVDISDAAVKPTPADTKTIRSGSPTTSA